MKDFAKQLADALERRAPKPEPVWHAKRNYQTGGLK